MPKIIGKYVLSKQIGQGNYGKVFLANEANIPVAVKVLSKQKCVPLLFQGAIKNEQMLAQTAQSTNLLQNRLLSTLKSKFPISRFKEEILALNALKNASHIISLIEKFESQNNNYIVYQYCEGGTLEQYIKQKECLSQCQALQILNQLFTAFKHLQHHGIIHRDVKSENIFLKYKKQQKIILKEDNELNTKQNTEQKLSSVRSDKQIKQNNSQAILNTKIEVVLADFGFCTQASFSHEIMGSPAYMAPQILNNQVYSAKADIWSLGIVLYEMLHGKCPFSEYSLQRLKIMYQKQLAVQKISQRNPLIDGSQRCNRKNNKNNNYSSNKINQKDSFNNVKNNNKNTNSSDFVNNKLFQFLREDLSLELKYLLSSMLQINQFHRISWEDLFYTFQFTSQGQIKIKQKGIQYDLIKLKSNKTLSNIQSVQSQNQQYSQCQFQQSFQMQYPLPLIQTLVSFTIDYRKLQLSLGLLPFILSMPSSKTVLSIAYTVLHSVQLSLSELKHNIGCVYDQYKGQNSLQQLYDSIVKINYTLKMKLHAVRVQFMRCQTIQCKKLFSKGISNKTICAFIKEYEKKYKDSTLINIEKINKDQNSHTLILLKIIRVVKNKVTDNIKKYLNKIAIIKDIYQCIEEK